MTAAIDGPAAQDRTRAASGVPAAAPTAPGSPSSPALPAQVELWHLDRGGAAAALSISSAWWLDGALDEAALGAAVDDLMARHESLRSVFRVQGGVPRVHVTEATTGHLRVLDAPCTDRNRLTGHLRALCAEPFDLERGPLARWWLIRISRKAYAMVVNLHHIVADASSLAVIERDLTRLYLRARSGSRHDDPPERSLLDLLDAHARIRGGARWHADVDYWTGMLDQPPDQLTLPFTDEPVAGGGGVREVLPDDVAAPLMDLCRRNRLTPFQVFCTGWTAFVARWANARDFVVGVPMAARADVEVHDAVGFFTNIVPIRITIGGDPMFLELAGQIRDRVYAALDHQRVSMAEILGRLRASTDIGTRNLTQVVFTHRSGVGDGFAVPGVRTTVLHLDSPGSLYDLAVQVEQAAGRWHIGVESRTTGSAVLAVVWQRYVALLRAAVTDPGSHLSGWPVILPQEQSAVTAPPVPAPVPPDSVPELIDRAGRDFASRTAVIDRHGTVTYWQLVRAARAIAGQLRDGGAEPGEVVAVCVERSRAAVAAVVGVMLAGCVYLPVDSRWPEQRMAGILTDAGVRRALVSPSTADLPGLRGVQRLPGWPAAGAAPQPPRTGTAAYLLYTSGSTGQPKGVLVGQHGLTNLIARMAELDGLPERPRILCATNLTFDISLVELLLPLVLGGTCIVADDTDFRDPMRLAELIAQHGVTCVQATPTMWAALLEHLDVDVPFAISGGEPLEPGLRDRLLDRCGTVINGYGPTEATIYTTMWRAARGERVSIGQPLGNVGTWVLDEWDRPCAPGTVGRLVVGGTGLALGYLNRPELTRRAFRYAIGGMTGGRAYETGDLASRGSAGQIYLHGRRDGQIKLRGYRIELGEIESVLSWVDGVSACAVVPYTIGAHQRGLAAFVTSTESPHPSQPELLRRIDEALRTALPEYMRPQLVRRIDSMPRVPAGKVDRPALIRMVAELITPPAARPGKAASVTSGEVRAVWQEILGATDPPTEVSFFALGGDSIGAAQVIARLRHRFGSGLTLQDFLDAPTVDGLARLIDERASRSQGG